MIIGERDGENEMDWLWVDFLEEEVDAAIGQDLKKLLQLSGEQKQKLENLLWTKEIVKSIDPSHEDYLKKWDKKATASRIMDACDKIQRDFWIQKNWKYAERK